ncbi:hypothetical protein HK101_011621 [Irineochytrium annulatum]|nr:hypothetical protein HK101_011621 [Irineochytrium annulatum]
MRLEGLENVVLFDQNNQELPADLSRDLIDRVWTARERLQKAAVATGSSYSHCEDIRPPATLMSLSFCSSPSAEVGRDRRSAMSQRSGHKSLDAKSAKRRQSWWERRRLEEGEVTVEGVCGDGVGQLDAGGVGRSEPDDDAADARNLDVSVRDWLMDDDGFCSDVGRNEVSRLLLDLINVLENLEGADLDIIGLAHHDRQGFGGPHLYVADGMSELVGATAAAIIADDTNALKVNHIVSLIDYSGDPTEQGYPVHIHTNFGLYHAKCVIVTVPLGVLKHHHRALFHPHLPEHIIHSIENLGFGLIDKVIMEFSEPFWPSELDGFWAFLPELKRGVDFDEGVDAPSLAGFVNLERMHAAVEDDGNGGQRRVPGPPVLVAYVAQRHALRIEKLADQDVAELFLTLLKGCFGRVAELELVRIFQLAPAPHPTS